MGLPKIEKSPRNLRFKEGWGPLLQTNHHRPAKWIFLARPGLTRHFFKTTPGFVRKNTKYRIDWSYRSYLFFPQLYANQLSLFSPILGTCHMCQHRAFHTIFSFSSGSIEQTSKRNTYSFLLGILFCFCYLFPYFFLPQGYCPHFQGSNPGHQCLSTTSGGFFLQHHTNKFLY